MNRADRAEISKQTMEILETGTYMAPSGNAVDIADALDNSVANSKYIDINDHPAILESVYARLADAEPKATDISVVNQTTFQGVQELLDSGATRVACLNFASAKNPGGGWQMGSAAQEEALTRASGLFPTLMRHFALYEANRRGQSCLYTHRMIYSPDVPVFRNDELQLLEQPFPTSIITSAAVNAGVVRHRERNLVSEIPRVMKERMERVLALAVHNDHKHIVLGAWGCGVFQNNPESVAHWFAQHLVSGQFKNAFESVRFAVLDRGGKDKFIGPFRRVFEQS